MLDSWTLFVISTGYVAVLFGIAYFGDRRARVSGPPPRKPWVYSLALCVYCTSWTFYGAVGRAANSGWDFLPIYLGPAIAFLFGGSLLSRAIRVTERHNITSIADFIGARYGRHQPVAMLVTIVAVVGVVPYIALQLKGISFGFDVLVSASSDSRQSVYSALAVTTMLAAFAMLFGTRELVSTEKHHGMMLAIAFESVVKLAVFLAVGLYVVYGLRDGFWNAYERALELPQMSSAMASGTWQIGFVTQTLLAAVAVICLPRQFHVTAIENTVVSDLHRARWIFPCYLTIISIFVIPIAATGLELFGPGLVSADTFVLALPLAGGHPGLTLAAYLGGFSAATGMVIVETIALSTMISNEIVLPLLLRSKRLVEAPGNDLSNLIKVVRRVSIVGIIGLAYAYFRLFTGRGSLTEIGLLSFAAVAQFAPSFIGGLVWRKGRYTGVVAGLIVGFGVWVYTLLLPAVLMASGQDLGILRTGPFSLAWLRPGNLFGIWGADALTHGVFWSLSLNLVFYVGVSLLKSPGLRDRLQAAKFMEDAEGAPISTRELPRSSATVGDLQELVERFLGVERATGVFAEYSVRGGQDLLGRGEQISPDLARYVEHVLAGVLGTSSARLVLATTLRGKDMSPEDVVRLLDETSHALQFSRELLRAALENLSQGVSVVDSELRLVGWNQRYAELFEYPPGLLIVGRSIEELLRYNATRGWLVSPDLDAAVERRLAFMRAGKPYSHEREIGNGTVLEILGNPMPDGGFVTSFSDVTAYKRTQRALQEANETLEDRVMERTRALTALNVELNLAKTAAERANDAKTRFLATATHDLVQPTTAARLFISSIDASALSPSHASLLARAEGAIGAGETLLGSLLDISRLDAGGQEARIENFALSEVVGPLTAEFAAIAQNRGLTMRAANCNYVVASDPRLLRRMLQNILSNAVRYTKRGGVLLGCRRRGKTLSLEVWDTGRGIPEEHRSEIFEEFRRLDDFDDDQERGLGLGLAIVDRISRMLDHPVALKSWPGRGSVFAISVPLGDPLAICGSRPARESVDQDRLAGRRVICLENEPAVLSGIEALLASWGCRPVGLRDRASALDWIQQGELAPDILLVDYHLDGVMSGIELAHEIQEIWRRAVPSIVLTADYTLDAQAAAERHGFQILRKPVKPAALRALMNSIIA
jgi:Na+/proline symporter/signal transduction histidine kinase